MEENKNTFDLEEERISKKEYLNEKHFVTNRSSFSTLIGVLLMMGGAFSFFVFLLLSRSDARILTFLIFSVLWCIVGIIIIASTKNRIKNFPKFEERYKKQVEEKQKAKQVKDSEIG